MVLSDKEIVRELLHGNITITPLLRARKQIGSSSIDVRLGTEFRYIKIVKQTHFDLSLSIDEIREQISSYIEVVHVQPMEPFILHPNDFVLASTLEYIMLPSNITGRLEGRSTWGRTGLQVHSTAGFVDPGFEGSLTYELHNMGKLPLQLFPGIRIGQISFHRMESAVEKYTEKEGAKYAKTTGTKNPLFYEDYEYQVIQKYLAEKKQNKS
jgi:dCTP deaminase